MCFSFMKTYLFVGASSAIAQELAKNLLNQGHKVIALSRSQPTCDYTSYFPFDLENNKEFPKIEGQLMGWFIFLVL